MKYKLVFDISSSGAINVDVREESDGYTIGHLVLSDRGIRWVEPKHEIATSGCEVSWDKVRGILNG